MREPGLQNTRQSQCGVEAALASLVPATEHQQRPGAVPVICARAGGCTSIQH